MNEKKYIDRDAVLDLVEKALMKAEKSARDAIATLGNAISTLPLFVKEATSVARQNELDRYDIDIEVTEPNLFGEYTGESYLYRRSSRKPFNGDDFEDMIFQICEIERIYKGKIFCVVTKTKNGEYLDGDECELEVDAKLTNELSSYIKWGETTEGLPPIYKIDRANSSIKAIY